MAYRPTCRRLLVGSTFLAILVGSVGTAFAGHGSGAAGGICVDNSGRNVPCRHRSSGGSNRQATIYNNRGVNLLNRGFRTKSLATVSRAIANFRRANAIQPHWIHQRNLFAARTYYWTLKASKISDCPKRLSYLRNATRTMHYYPARKKRNFWSRVRKLERLCRQIAKANANRQPVRSPVTGQKGAEIGVAGAVKGYVQMCWKGKCTRVKTGATVRMGATIKTGPKGRMQVLLLDETAFTIGPYSEITLNKFDYDPISPAGQIIAIMNRGVFRLVTGKVERKRPNRGIKLPTGTIGIRGTDFVLRLNPATRTVVIELLEGALSFKPTGGQAERAISPGVWVIKWYERRTGRQHRIRRVRAYRSAGDRVLARRRAYYNRVLPAKRRAGAGAAARSYATTQAAIAAILDPNWRTGRAAQWRYKNGFHGNVTPNTGFYRQTKPPANCRKTSYAYFSPEKKRAVASGYVCRWDDGVIVTVVRPITGRRNREIMRRATGGRPAGSRQTRDCTMSGKIYPLGSEFHNGPVVVLKCLPNGVWLRVK